MSFPEREPGPAEVAAYAAMRHEVRYLHDPEYREMKDGLAAQLAQERESHERTTRQAAHAVAVAFRWQERAETLREVVELIDLDRADMNAPEDEHIGVLCARCGYGAVMDAAARLWARRDPIGAKTVGPCRGTVESALRVYDER